MHHRYLGLLLLAAVATTACSTTTSAAVRAAPPTAAEVRAVFDRFDRPDGPGCAVGVGEGARAVFAAGYGAADLSFGVPIAPDTAFDIGSTSKQFTAASILLLERDGKLSLDDDVRKHVPELPDYGRTIALRNLLHHTSGLRDFVTLLMFADVDFGDVVTAPQVLDILARQKALNFMPGEQQTYSNSGYFLLGQIVERVSGQSLAEFAEQRLFGPLGMTHTRFKDRHDTLIPRRATGYSPGEIKGGPWRVDTPHWEEVGDGGVVSTVGDLLTWNRNFATPVVGGADFAERMERTGVLAGGKALHYAAGLMVDDHDGLRMVHHGGSWGGYRAEVVRFPQRGLTVATLCNSALADASALAIRTAELWLGKAEASDVPKAQAPVARPAKVDPKVLAGWAGVYRSPDSGSLRTVEQEDGALRIVTFGGRFGLRPVDSFTFDLVDGPFEARYRFAPATATAPRVLSQVAMGKTAEFRAIDLAHPTPEQVAGHAGDYDCPELGKVYRLEAKDGLLTRRDPRGEIWTFDALDRDAFGYGNLTIRFQRGPGGAIYGARLDIGRVRDLACRRL